MSAVDGLPLDEKGAWAAIGTMCAGILCLSINDAMAKWLTSHYGPLEIMVARNIIAVPMIALIAAASGGFRILRTPRPAVHALRGLLMVAASYTFFRALGILPLAEATSLVFVAPIFITALSVPLLKEHVGWRRWVAVLIGFLGVLVIIRPGGAAFQSASLLPIATALFYALFMISARWIDKAESFWATMFYVALFPLIYAGPVVATEWHGMALAHLPLFFGLAVFGTLGVTLIGQAFRLAPAAVVAPFDYTGLLWASLLGWLFWGELPDLWTYIGAAVIAGSGIYVVWREQAAGRRAAGGKPVAASREGPARQ